jgi:uncharacterized damage-inducible protein DinB
VWVGRFTGTPHPVAAYGADAHDDFADLARARENADRDILGWAGALTDAWLAPRSSTAPRPTASCARCLHGSARRTCSSMRRITAGRSRR